MGPLLMRIRRCPHCKGALHLGKKANESYNPALPEGWKRCPQCGRSGQSDLFQGKRKAGVKHCVHCQFYFAMLREEETPDSKSKKEQDAKTIDSDGVDRRGPV